MKSVKKFFFAFFALLMSFGLFSALTNAKADVVVQVTPWTLSFDNGDVFNVMEDDNSLSVVANAFSVTYLDTTGNTTGGYFDVFRESLHMEGIDPYVTDQYIQNGQTLTFNLGGPITLRFHSADPTGEYKWFELYLYRSIIDTNRIVTNLNPGQYYYNHSIRFGDYDRVRYGDPNLIFEIYNLTTNELNTIYGSQFMINFYIEKEGEYEVTVTDLRKDESRVYRFAIDQTAPVIQLVEWDYMVETPVLSGTITSAGMKVVYGDNIKVNSMTYQYKPFTSSLVETGTVDNNFIFWRKGEYVITVTDMIGNVTTQTFQLTDFDVVADPDGAQTLGTEVTQNGGAKGGTTLHVGYTRCLYLGGDAPSQSRLDYTFTSSNPSIATVSNYGTVMAKGAGTVVITCVLKSNPSKVSKIVLTVLP